MYYFFAFVAAVVLIVGVTLWLGRHGTGFMHRHNEVHEELVDERTPTLEYVVPTGQDPTVLLAALGREGYTATSDTTHPHQRVLVACPDGLATERERVRRVIESVNVTTPDDGVPLPVDVRFADER